MKSRNENRVSILVGISTSLIGLGLFSQAEAGDLRAPFDLESAAVLPAGIGNPRVKNVMTWIDEKYSGAGVPEPLAVKINKQVTWEELLHNLNTDDRTKIQGLLGTGDYGKTAGRTNGEITSFARVTAPVLGFGITDRWTTAFAVPIVNINISVSTGFVRSQDAQNLVEKANQTDPNKANEASDRLNNAVQDKLRVRKYEALASMSESHVGDVTWINKFLIHQDPSFALALKGGATAPTGRPANPDRVVDTASGDGDWKLIAGAIAEKKFPESKSNWIRNLRWDNSLSFTEQLPDQIEKRVPESDTESLSAPADSSGDWKESVRRKLGNIWNFGSSLTYEFGESGFSIGAGYYFQYMNATTYDGDKFEKRYYRYLEGLAPEELLHSGVITAGYSGVNAYRAKKIPIPFQINASYSQPLRGINTATAPLFAGEVVLFF